jgi:gluconate 2-dehydrogenase gamma chain
MERRTVLKLIGAGVMTDELGVAQHHPVVLAQTSAALNLQFFSLQQEKLLDRLCEMIIPADERSSGAHEAGVSRFIDLMVAHSQPSIQQEWVAGLEGVENEARAQFRKRFLECAPEEQDRIMAGMAAEEFEPSTALGRFFVLLKSRTLDGYYTSQIGIHQELRYKGNRPQAEFIGCSHPEHGG